MDEAQLLANKSFIHDRMNEALQHVKNYLVPGAKLTMIWRVGNEGWAAASDDDLQELVAFLDRKFKERKVKSDLPPSLPA